MRGKTPELKHRREKKRREAFMALMFLMPSLLGLIFLSLLPMVISMVASLTDWEYTRGLGNWNYVGTKNFVDLFSDSWFIKSLKNTIVYTIGTVPVGIFIALVIATLIDNFCSDKIAGYVRIALYMPNICNVVAVSVIYTLQEPLSRMERVNFLVSTPEIPGISKVFITSDNVETPLKLDGSSLYSRTISAPMVGISRS